MEYFMDFTHWISIRVSLTRNPEFRDFFSDGALARKLTDYVVPRRPFKFVFVAATSLDNHWKAQTLTVASRNTDNDFGTQ